jgi:hypothetical protein
LKNPDASKIFVENAYQDLDLRFSWEKLAKQTIAVYQQVFEERSSVQWH